MDPLQGSHKLRRGGNEGDQQFLSSEELRDAMRPRPTPQQPWQTTAKNLRNCTSSDLLFQLDTNEGQSQLSNVPPASEAHPDQAAHDLA